MTQQRKRCGKGGFTLVELVVTLVILSILLVDFIRNSGIIQCGNKTFVCCIQSSMLC